jgi:hypothetical protein
MFYKEDAVKERGDLAEKRGLRVYRDGRIESAATLAPEMLRAPRRTSEPAVSVVAGERFGTSARPRARAGKVPLARAA